jgi:hypothetical protein
VLLQPAAQLKPAAVPISRIAAEADRERNARRVVLPE